MRPDDPRHGTYRGYLAHRKDGEEKCGPCKQAASRYHKRYTIYRPNPRVPLGDRAHRIVAATRDTSALAKATGLSASNLSRLKRVGPDARVLLATQAAILRAGHPVGILGARRRLQALAALGWSSTVIAAATGINVDNVNRIRRGDRKHYCREDIAARIASVYDDLCMSLPEPTRATAYVRAQAARAGWAPPLSWTDIDDPNERPKGVMRRESVNHRRADLLAEWEHLRSLGVSMHAAAQQLGVSVKAIEKAQERARGAA